MSESPLITSLRAAVAAAPDDVPLRLHLAQLLLDAGHSQDAITQVAAALQRDPGNTEAQALIARAVAPPVAPPAAADPEPPRATASYDWKRAENELSEVIPPRFVESQPESQGEQEAHPPLAVDGDDGDDGSSLWDVEAGSVKLADVGGMYEVKERLEAAFLAPMRNPELRKLYGKSLRGGLLMYGPPGCGKTYIARAVAGELGARFMAVTISDVLDMWIGNSERNLRQLFETARRNAPCVLFLDEIDALGAKRSQVRNTGMRTTVNQLLTELDGVNGSANEGVFVLAATNHPWDVDTALRRPGRLDRMLLVLPPDQPAREGILHHHLKDRPVANIDLAKLAKRTDGFSGADLQHLCESAAERALLDSIRTGKARMIEMSDLLGALDQVRPSTGPWFASARNVAQFANEGGAYDELLAYLKRKKML
ncbi:ATP-binding protein [Streptomyces sp. NPDC002537]